MILIGIDDTDTLETVGTNQLARALVAQLADRYRCLAIVRHQLLFDDRVPYTSKNGSASIQIQANAEDLTSDLITEIRLLMQQWYVPGSDPGLCVTTIVPDEITHFARRCQVELMQQSVARELAAKFGIHLEGLGGTEDGVIGALAAVGLAACGQDGRAVQIETWPDDLSGPQPVAVLAERGVRVRQWPDGMFITSGVIDVGKKLRPNVRDRGMVLFVRPGSSVNDDAGLWEALKLT